MSLTAACLSLLLAQAPPSVEDGDKIAARVFEVPLHIAPGRSDDIDKLRLWVSRDKGLTWAPVTTVPPTHAAVPFKAPADGQYWFAVQVIDKDGKTEPERPGADHKILKVLVETAAAKRESRKPWEPRSDRELIQELQNEVGELREQLAELQKQLGVSPPQKVQAPHALLYAPSLDYNQPGALIFEWQARSAHPKATIRSVSLQWAEVPGKTWHAIGLAEMANTGRYPWRVPADVPSKVYLRLIVRDSAGRKAVAETEMPIELPLRR